MKSFWNKAKPFVVTGVVAVVGVIVVMAALSKFAPNVRQKVTDLTGGL